MKRPLKDIIYRTLRDYQDGKLPHGSGCYVSVGMLDESLTAVYDLICAAVDAERKLGRA